MLIGSTIIVPLPPVCPLLDHQFTTEEEAGAIHLPGTAKYSHSKKKLIRVFSEGPDSTVVARSI